MTPRLLFDGVIALYLVVLALMVRRLLRQRAEVRASANWVPAASRVISSRLDEVVASKGGRTMWPVVVYEYEVGGRVLRGERAAFGDPVGYNLERRVRRRLDALVAAASVRVFHHPTDPTQSVIERRAPVMRRNGVLFGILLGVLGGVIWLRVALL